MATLGPPFSIENLRRLSVGPPASLLPGQIATSDVENVIWYGQLDGTVVGVYGQSSGTIIVQAPSRTVAQNAHGFVPGNEIYCPGTTQDVYALATSDTAAHAAVVGTVTVVPSTNVFTYQPVGGGFITIPASIWTPGQIFYLSPTVSSNPTSNVQTTPPAAPNLIVPLWVAITANVGVLFAGGGAGGSGSPDLAAIAALTGTGFLVRTGTGTWALRVLVEGTGIIVTNDEGIAGNPTIAVDETVIATIALLDSTVAAAEATAISTAEAYATAIGSTIQPMITDFGEC
jgi:hypothetical protein